MALDKATISDLSSGLDRATISNLTTGEKLAVTVLFNPEEYSLNRDINYAQIASPCSSGPLLQFVHGNMQTLEMELFFDTYEARDDVRAKVASLTDLMNIEPTTH